MIIIYAILTILLVFFSLYFLFPKETVIHELIRVLPFHYHCKKTSLAEMKVTKVKYGDHSRQYILVCKPEQKHPPKSVIIYVHGGGWRFGNPETFLSNAKVLVDQGHIVFMASHRRVPSYKYPDLRKDLNDILQKVIFLKKEDGLENQKIIVGGMSSGGNLMAHLLFNRKELVKLDLNQNIFAGGFFCGAPLELNELDDVFALRDFTGKRASSMFFQANPINHLEAKETLPILCIHGTKDGLVSYQSCKLFVAKIKTTNPQIIKFYTIEKGTHLDAGKWAFQNSDTRKTLLSWLLQVEKNKSKEYLSH